MKDPITIDQTAEILGVSRQTVWKYERKHVSFPKRHKHPLTGHVYFERADVEAWKKEHTL
jgi:predicted DNA-binding transcriptional regulator AlpA